MRRRATRLAEGRSSSRVSASSSAVGRCAGSLARQARMGMASPLGTRAENASGSSVRGLRTCASSEKLYGVTTWDDLVALLEPPTPSAHPHP